MSREALYSKYRSSTFEEVVGQEYVVRSIKNAIREGKVGHAYLFCGPRGTGKTTMARLLARAINCEDPQKAPCGQCSNCRMALEGTHPDIIEINAANETHVEDIRDLIERAQLAPMVGHHKVYIIDEVHQLSTAAASALLKTLEEPPEHVIFILATTDPQKLIKTIISRCQRFDFSRLDTEKIKNHLLHIAKQEGFTLTAEAAVKIAELADGGMRDSLSILEQANAYGLGVINEETIDQIFGLASMSEKIGLLDDLLNKDLGSVLKRIEEAQEHGVDLSRLTGELADALKDGVIWSYTENEGLLHSLNKEYASHLLQKADAERLLAMVKVLMSAQDRYRTAVSIRTVFEVACMEIITASTLGNSSVKSVSQSVVPVLSATVRTVEPVGLGQEEKKIEVEKEEPARMVEPEQVPQSDPMPYDEPDVVEQRQTVQLKPVFELNEDDVLSILVQCDKKNKSEDEPRFSRLALGVPKDRYQGSLKHVVLQASGTDVVLLCTDTAAQAHIMMEEEFNKELYELFCTAGMDKMPFIVEQDVAKKAIGQFVARRNAGTLPAPRSITRYERKKVEVPEDALSKAKRIFGEDLVEVIE